MVISEFFKPNTSDLRVQHAAGWDDYCEELRFYSTFLIHVRLECMIRFIPLEVLCSLSDLRVILKAFAIISSHRGDKISGLTSPTE